MRFVLPVLLACSVINAQDFFVRRVGKAAAGGGGSITFDVAGAGAVNTGTSTTAAHTVTSSIANSAVVAIVTTSAGAVPATGCTHNGNAMTQMWNFRETALTYIGTAAYIIATGTGDGVSRNVVCSGASTDRGVMTLSFSGVNQTTPARTAATASYVDTTGTFAVTVSNAQNGDVVVAGISILLTTAPTSSQTSRATQTNIAGSGFSGATATTAATGSQVMTYTFATGEQYAALGAAALIPQ